MSNRSLKLSLPQSPGQVIESLRSGALQPAGPHRVYLSFVRNRDRWYCRFHQGDLVMTPISRQFVFHDAEKVHETARRGNGVASIESHQDLDEALTIGRGGVWLDLNDDQFSALIKSKSSKRLQS